jgi:G3E family GTPase
MRKQGAFDYIMLETTGLADPGEHISSVSQMPPDRPLGQGPIAAMFWQNEEFSDQISLDGIICVVDGVFGLKVGRAHTKKNKC